MLTPEEEENVRTELESYRREIDAVLNQTSRILTQMTHFPSMILGPDLESAVFRHVELVPLDSGTLMMLVVTGSGRVEHRTLEFHGPMDDADLAHISLALNRHLRGRTFEEIRAGTLAQIRSEIIAHDRFFEEVLRLLTGTLRPAEAERVRVDGTINIMEQPEFREVDKLKPLLELLSGEGSLGAMMASAARCSGVQVQIGSENEWPDMHECSVVTSTYEVGGRTMGVIGVLGPTRMEYNRVVTVVEHVAECLSEVLSRMNRSR